MAAAKVSPAAEPKYKMTVDLSVLESLGINLYSNAAAVLSELVANAYDADATLVEITWKKNNQRVVVTDDGVGMSASELNKRFLKVGYKKRDNEGTQSKRFERPYMGRKGIGKLSVFSIAESVAVYSTKRGKSNGLKIDVEKLEAAIRAGEAYYPQPVNVPSRYATKGTTIVLDQLRSKRANLTAVALRKRLARRFDVLDQTPRSKGGFYIDVNSKRITFADRQELKKLEFIWEFGTPVLPNEALPGGVTRYTVSHDLAKAGTTWRVRGWFGTAHKPTDLTDRRGLWVAQEHHRPRPQATDSGGDHREARLQPPLRQLRDWPNRGRLPRPRRRLRGHRHQRPPTAHRGRRTGPRTSDVPARRVREGRRPVERRPPQEGSEGRP